MVNILLAAQGSKASLFLATAIEGLRESVVANILLAAQGSKASTVVTTAI